MNIKKLMTIGIIAVALFVMSALPAFAGQGQYVPGEVIVKFRAGTSQVQIDAANQHAGGYGNRRPAGIHGIKLDMGSSVEAALVSYSNDPAVEYAEPNYILHALATTPNDYYYNSNQWNLPMIQAHTAWDTWRGSSSVTIAIIDTGVSMNHPDLAGKIVAGYDFVANDSNPTDENGHGTHVAGIAAAITNNWTGVAGVDWYARIMPIRVLDAGGSGNSDDVADGIYWAANNGAKVINMSLGDSAYSQTVQNAIDYAYGEGVVVVAAAGNNGNGTVLYPASGNHVISVAATDSSDNRASFSNYNAYVDVAAPGVSVASTYWDSTNGNGYGIGTGTSMATPHVAGLASLLFSLHPTWTPLQIETVIESSAADRGTVGKDPYYGYGRIDARAAVNTQMPPDHFDVSYSSPQTAGSAFAINISAKDASDATMTDFTGRVSISDTTGTVSPTQSGFFASGVWNGNVTVTKATASDQIRVSYGMPAVTGTGSVFTVNAAAPNRIAVTPFLLDIKPGASRELTAAVFDAYDNPISDAVIDWSWTGGNMSSSQGSPVLYTAGYALGRDYYITARSTVEDSIKVIIGNTIMRDLNLDAKAEIGVLYNYGNNVARLWSMDASGPPGAAQPLMAWYWNGGFDANRAKITNGDYDNDGKAEIGVLYDYGNNVARLWSMDASGPGAAQPLMAWYWNGGFDASRAKITSGDYNGDGKAEIGVLYNYGNNVARLWTMDASGPPGAAQPVMAWYWNGGFDANRAKITSGDYNNDGKDEIGVLYDYGNNVARLWTMDASGPPDADPPVMAWYWNGGFDANRAKITSGDYNMDGRTEIGVLYNYGNNVARLWSMDASGPPGAAQPLMAWYWNGGLDANRAKITSGDYNGDGKTEIGVLYDYGNNVARLWSMDASGPPGADQPLMVWYWNGGFDSNRSKITD